MIRRGFLALLLVLLCLGGGWTSVFPARAEVAIPALTAHVIDLTDTLGAAEAAGLDERLKAYEREKGTQVVVLILPTTEGEAIESYALRVAESWKLGRKGVDDGVLFVVAKEDRKMRIEVGYGLEGALSDLVAKRIISDLVAPLFRKGDFTAGVTAGVDAILKVATGEDLPLPDSSLGSGEGGGEFPLLLIGLIFVFWQIASAMGEVMVSDALTFGGVSGVISLFAVGWILALIVAVVVFLFTLLAPILGPGSYGHRGRWGGDIFGGGGGGGWGGGGGRFGGGGASGGW